MSSTFLKILGRTLVGTKDSSDWSVITNRRTGYSEERGGEGIPYVPCSFTVLFKRAKAQNT